MTVGGRTLALTATERVRAFVKQLRDDAAHPAFILTERGVGYRMAGPGEKN